MQSYRVQQLFGARVAEFFIFKTFRSPLTRLNSPGHVERAAIRVVPDSGFATTPTHQHSPHAAQTAPAHPPPETSPASSPYPPPSPPEKTPLPHCPSRAIPQTCCSPWPCTAWPP